MAGWEKFKAAEGTETVVIAGEIFEIRRSLKAREVREALAKAGSDVQKIYRELLKALVVSPKFPEDEKEFIELWDEMDAAIQGELVAKVMEKSGLDKLFRLSMA